MLDSYALLAYLENEAGALQVKSLLSQAETGPTIAHSQFIATTKDWLFILYTPSLLDQQIPVNG